jgi:hypothetical protein
MTGKIEIVFHPDLRPVHAHLEPIVDLLLASGNQLAHGYRWGEDRTGFFCHLARPIDFDLIEATFTLPSGIRLDRAGDVLECDLSWATIRGCV